MPGRPRRGMSKARRERAAKALDLREGGATYEQIGKALGISTKRAYDDVQDCLKEITREPSEAVLEMELRRLDSLWRTAYVQAKGGNLKAIHGALQIMDRRIKLQGLDKPEGTNGAQLDTVKEAYAAMFDLGVRAGQGEIEWAETNPLDPPQEPKAEEGSLE